MTHDTQEIPLTQIVEPPEPMRLGFDEEKLEDLADSIKQIGLQQPIVVVPEIVGFPEPVDLECCAQSQAEPQQTGRYEIVAGHRRFLACRMLGMETMPCIVHRESGFNRRAAMLHENIIREEVTPFEEGNMYLEVASRPGITEAELQRTFRKPLKYIYERMELLKGDSEVALAVHRGHIKLAVAKELNKCGEDQHRRYLLMMAIDGGCTAKQAMSWVQQWQVSQGLRPPLTGEIAVPPPVAPPQGYVMQCALCGQSDRTYDLDSVYICRSELKLIKASFDRE